MATLQQSVREVFSLQSQVAGIDDDEHDASIEILRQLADHPCAWHLVDRSQVYEVIAEHHRQAGREDEAAAAERAMADSAAEPPDERCQHCGLTPSEADAAIELATRDAEQRSADNARGNVSVSMAWFPPTEWPLAVAKWPDLLDELPSDHGEYSHKFEARLKRMHRLRPGIVDHVSPLGVADLEDWARQRGYDPNSGEARAGYAGVVRNKGQATPWPPARNDRCWCQSGRKYKQCCGPVPPEPEPERRSADEVGPDTIDPGDS